MERGRIRGTSMGGRWGLRSWLSLPQLMCVWGRGVFSPASPAACACHAGDSERLRANWAELSGKLEECDCAAFIIQQPRLLARDTARNNDRPNFSVSIHRQYQTEGEKERGGAGIEKWLRDTGRGTSDGMKGAIWWRTEECKGQPEWLQ